MTQYYPTDSIVLESIADTSVRGKQVAQCLSVRDTRIFSSSVQPLKL